MRLFFATDIHGSDLCFRKFLRAPEFYGVDALFLGGDYSSKSLVACVRSNNKWQAKLHGEVVGINTRSDLEQFRTECLNRGYLVIELNQDEFEAFQLDEGFRQKSFESAQREKLHQWTNMASEQLGSSGVRIYHIPGNDEPQYCDEFFNDLPFVPVHCRHILISNNLAVLGFGGSNPTPWHTPREYEESEIERLIEMSFRPELKGVPMIFFGHVPPYKSGLDNAPALNPDLSYKLVLGSQKKEPVGSSAIHRAIKRLQPLVALFGHIHESEAEIRIGKTLCINPGSVYYNARLRGCIVTVRNERASVQFTEG